MKLKLYSVFDSKIGVYCHPMCLLSTGEALRAFGEIFNDPASKFNKYPADFTLFEIGEFDDSDCSFVLYDAKVSLGAAIEFIASARSERNKEVST